MMRHFYFGIENVGLTATQKETLVTALKLLGPKTHPSPACLCHWRIRLDGEAAIFEALFNEDNLTIQAGKDRLASIFGIDPGAIVDSVQQTSYGPLVTFSYSGDKLRFLMFGGANATLQESRDACRAYLKANLASWELPL